MIYIIKLPSVTGAEGTAGVDWHKCGTLGVVLTWYGSRRGWWVGSAETKFGLRDLSQTNCECQATLLRVLLSQSAHLECCCPELGLTQHLGLSAESCYHDWLIHIRRYPNSSSVKLILAHQKPFYRPYLSAYQNLCPYIVSVTASCKILWNFKNIVFLFTLASTSI